MAKSQRSIVFLGTGTAEAKAAEIAFATTASRLGMSWSTRSYQVSDFTGEHLSGASVLVLVGEVSYDIKDWVGRLEHLERLDMGEGVSKLFARLLGGRDDVTLPPPVAPKPAVPKKDHTVKLSRETAGRRGKGVTVVSELPLNEDQLKELATKLKTACGTGGTAKEGRIEIQGDQRDRIAIELEKLGYKVKRAGG